MTSVTQKIPRYILGMSDQPDDIKVPGQVRDALNVLPDVTLGLLKRPGLKGLGTMGSDSTGTWFSIYKNNRITYDERYMCQITLDGYVNIWSMKTGKKMSVKYADEFLDVRSEFAAGFYTKQHRTTSGPEDYFIHNRVGDLHTMSVNDYTFVTNRNTSVSMSGSIADKRPYEAFVEIKALAYNQNYILDFDKPADTEPDPDPVLITYTTATAVSVSPDGWNTSTYCNNAPGCDYAGSWTKTLNSGSGTDLNVTVTISCVAVPDGCVGNSVSESYSLSATLNNGGSGWSAGQSVYFPEARANVRVDSIDSTTSSVGGDGRASYVQSNTDLPLDASAILQDLKSDIEGLNKGYTVEIIGNGLYITNDDPFTVSTPDPTLMDAVSSANQQAIGETEPNYITQVNNIGRLPIQCKHGYIAKVVNTGAEEDDYYVQFYGNNGLDGEGVWEECAKPGIPHTINGFSMPHAIIRTSNVVADADGDPISEFYVGPMGWEARPAGDELTNPRPSFCPPPGANFGNAIQATLFFRDRLVFLSEENIVMSRTSDHFALFGKSALTIAADDPIDVAASSTIPAVLSDGIVVPVGLLVISPNQQFLLRTDNDLLSPLTTKVTNIASYNVNKNTKPISLGTTVGFFSDAGKYSRFYEMADITTSGDPQVVEQSKVAGTLLPQALEFVADSQENDLVLACERDSNEVWCYKYFNTGEKRVLNSWFHWILPGPVLHHTVIYDSYYAAIVVDGEVTLVRMDLRPLKDTTLASEDDFRIHLDLYQQPPVADYDAATRKTLIEYKVSEPGTWIAYDLDTHEIQEFEDDGGEAYLRGDWSNANFVIGRNFPMKIEFPRLYVNSKDGISGQVKADTRASLIIQRLKLDLGDSGYFEAHLKCKGRPDRTITYESAFQDGYEADAIAMVDNAIRTIPVYDRNTNFNLELISEHPSPATLYSMEWEGDYTNMYYRSV